MENNKSSIIIVVIAIVIAIFLGIGFATHWFTMGVDEHTEMKTVSAGYVV